MREILFRGKTTLDNEWVIGAGVYKSEGHTWIITDDVTKTENRGTGSDAINPETVGQYTGLTDKNGTRVFEGDILVFCKGATYPYKIEWDGMGWKLYRSDGKRIKEAFECNEIHYVNISEVIGNIHDNPELLEGGEG